MGGGCQQQKETEGHRSVGSLVMAKLPQVCDYVKTYQVLYTDYVQFHVPRV